MTTTYTDCVILYATQSGRAKACARRVARLLREQTVVRPSNGFWGQTFDEAIVEAKSTTTTRTTDSAASDLIQYAHQLQRRAADAPFLLLLFVSTTGDGEQTDTIQQTWKQLLQKSLPSDLFAGIPVAIFNLGDRAYGDQFCAAGRKVAVRLLQLGATLYCPIGYGDDQTPNGGVFQDLDYWVETVLFPAVLQQQTQQPLLDNASSSLVSDVSSMLPPNPYRVTVTPPVETTTTTVKEEEWKIPEYAESYRVFFEHQRPLTAYSYNYYHHANNTTAKDDPQSTAAAVLPQRRVKQEIDHGNNNDNDNNSGYLLLGDVQENRRITADDWEQNTRHIRLTVRAPVELHPSKSTTKNTTTTTTLSLSSWSLDALPYRAGDVVSVLPSNDPKEVQAFLNVLPAHLKEMADHKLTIEVLNNDPITTTTTSTPKIWPRQCTLRGWLTYCADIHALPEREDLRALSYFCDTSSSIHHHHHPMGIDQAQKLKSLSETSASALYSDYILRNKRSWPDVLYDFDSIRHENNTTTTTTTTSSDKENSHDGNTAVAAEEEEKNDAPEQNVPPGALLSLEVLLSLLNPIRPREFSIASSPTKEWMRKANIQEKKKNNDGSSSGFGVELCVAVVEGTTPLGRSYHGLCSNYVGQLVPSQQQQPTAAAADTPAVDSLSIQSSPPSIVRLWIRPGTFHGLPLETTTESSSSSCLSLAHPVLFVGAGTGIAPLRGLILEREAIVQLRQQQQPQQTEAMQSQGQPQQLAENILLFGCRQAKSDFYYENEWKELQPRRLRLLTAFSQDQWHKIYVQQVLKQMDSEEQLVRQLVLQQQNTAAAAGGAIYIAGGPKMARAVKDEIVESLTKALGGGETNTRQAKQLLAMMQRQGRFSVEAWS